MQKNLYQLIIIGSGPASYNASIYASRSGINHTIISGDSLGGQLLNTAEIENYLGFPLVSGFELAEKFENHAKHFGANIISDTIDKIEFSSHPYTLYTKSGAEFSAKSIIIATGSTPKKLGVPGEAELSAKGVSYCATCDGNFYRNQSVAIVGGGNSALEEALFLANITKKVYLIHRRNEFRGDKILQDKIFQTTNIEILYNSQIKEIKGENSIEEIVLENTINKKLSSLTDAKGLFIAIGSTPNSQFLGKSLELDEEGYILTKGKTSLTNIKGVFAAGDIANPRYRQIIVAAASGAVAAMDTKDFLINNH